MRDRVVGSLTARLAVAFVAVALVAVGVLAGLTLLSSRSEIEQLADRQRDQDTASISVTAAEAYRQAGGWDQADLSGAFALATAARAELTVIDSDGVLVAQSPPDMGDLMAQMHGETAVSATALNDLRRVDVDVDGATVGVAELRFLTSGLDVPQQQVRDALARSVLIGAGIAVLVALAVGVLASRRVTRPIIALTATARRLESGDRDARSRRHDAPGELGELSRAFDQMADALHREDELRRTLVADVAHELRTPATILLATLEELVDGLADPTPARLASLHDEVLRLQRVIEDLETLASAQAAGLHLVRTPVDLSEVTMDAVDALRPSFDDAGLTLSTTVVHVVVEGDPDRLRQIVVNLLTNALKYTPRDGTVAVSVTAHDEWAQLTVADDGPGISPDEAPLVFERFWRGANARHVTGSGIGLTIVAELTRAHGGSVSVNSGHGDGAAFIVSLPKHANRTGAALD
jgi:two-component system sensor histidine kinase BaeS